MKARKALEECPGGESRRQRDTNSIRNQSSSRVDDKKMVRVFEGTGNKADTTVCRRDREIMFKNENRSTADQGTEKEGSSSSIETDTKQARKASKHSTTFQRRKGKHSGQPTIAINFKLSD